MPETTYVFQSDCAPATYHGKEESASHHWLAFTDYCKDSNYDEKISQLKDFAPYWAHCHDGGMNSTRLSLLL